MDDLEARLTTIARAAGQAILAVYDAGETAVDWKADDSPLTKADLAAHDVIVEGLADAFPDIPVLSEEGAHEAYATRAGWSRLFLVDPLDGTKEFIKRNGEFTVNIALVENGKAVAGVVHVPADGTTYWGQVGQGAVKIAKDGSRVAMTCGPMPTGRPIRVVASRSHRNQETEAFLAQLPAHELVPAGSSLKFCRVAEGAADLYPRLAPTMEWDTAAGHAVLEAAGGAVRRVDGAALRYNRENLLNPFFIAVCDPDWVAPGSVGLGA